MKKIYLFLAMSLFLSACGGGGSSGSDTNDTTAARDGIQGDWISPCQTRMNGTSLVETRSYFIADGGEDAFIYGLLEFNTSNCTGESSTLLLGGPVEYQGTHTTSICVAAKIDQEVVLISDGDTQLTDTDAQNFLIDNGLSPITYDIACEVDNQLLVGLITNNLNAGADSRRPEEMNVSVPYSVLDLSSKPATNQQLSLKERMARASLNLKTLAK